LYANTKFERWETPIVGALELRTISIIEDGELLVTLAEPSNRDRYRLRFRFDCGTYITYRSTDDVNSRYLIDAKYEGERPCRTFIAEQSEWRQTFLERGFLSPIEMPILKHFVIWTDDGCVEILALKPPEIYDF
jgi:hypothetical protein